MMWRRVAIRVFTAIAVLLCLLAILLATPWGSRLTIAIVDTVPGINTEYRSGSILRDLKLVNFSLHMDGLDIDIDEPEVNLHLRCAWRKRLCVTSLTAKRFAMDLYDAEDIEVEAEPVDEQADTEDSSTALIALPFSIRGDKVAVADIDIKIDDLHILVSDFSASALLQDALIEIKQPQASQVVVSLPPTVEQPEETTSEDDTWPLANMPRISIPLDLQVQSLQLGQLQLDMDGQLEEIDDIAISANWRLTQLTLEHLALAYTNMGALQMHGDAQLQDSYPLNLQTKAQLVQIDAWPQINNTQVELDLSGDLHDLALALNSEGGLQGKINGNVNLADRNLPFSAQIDASRLPLPAEVNQHVLPSQLDADINGNLHQQELVMDAVVSGYGYQQAELVARIQHQDQQVQIQALRIDAGDKGQVGLQGALDYAQGLQWQARAALQQWVLPDNPHAYGHLNGEFNNSGEYSEQGWQMRLWDTDIRGQINDMPARLSGDLAVNDKWHIPDSQVELQLQDLLLSVRGKADDQWALAGELNLASLREWQNDMGGKVQSSFAVSGEKANPKVDFNVQLQRFFWQQIAVPELTATGQYFPLDKHVVELSVSAPRLRREDLDVRDVKLDVSGNQSQQQIALSSNGDVPTTLVVNAQLDETMEQLTLGFEQAEFGINEFAWSLAESMQLEVDLEQGRVRLPAHCWQGQQNNLCVTQDANVGQDGLVMLTLQADLGAIDEFLLPHELTLETRLQGVAEAKWTAAGEFDLDGEFSVDAGKFMMETESEPLPVVNWQQGSVKLSMDESQANLKLAVKQQARDLIDVDLQILDNWQEIQGHALIQDFRLEPLAALIPEVTEIDGGLNAKLQLSGAMGAPDIHGDLAVENAQISLVSSPRPMEQVRMQVQFDGQRADINGGLEIGGQPASIQGQADWSSQLELDMALKSDELTLLYPPMVTATIKPDLSISLRPQKLSLTGDIKVLSGLVKIEQLPEGSVSTSKDQIFVDDDGKQIIEKQRFDVETDIRVSIVDEFKVEAMGFNGRLGGRLHLTQKQQDPMQIFGSLQIPDGRYRAYGQRLQVQKGEIGFNGPADNPHINLRAIREITSEDIIVGIQVLGLADNMELSFFSEPGMPQPEVMSYLVRGRGLDAETGNNAMLAMAVGASLANESGILQELEAVPLIHSIEVDTQGDGDETQATISGYIGDRIYLKYGVGVYEPINELTVRLYFLSRLWLETVSGLENSADLYYSFDIE